MKYWTAYLNGFSSFTFHFYFKIIPENYKEIILGFDKIFLGKGVELGLCIFDGLETKDAINQYLTARKRKFWTEPQYNNALDFLALEEDENYLG